MRSLATSLFCSSHRRSTRLRHAPRVEPETGPAAPQPDTEAARRESEAFARSMVHGPEAALVDLEVLANDPELAEHAGYHAAKADVLARLGRSEPAKKAYERAIALTKNEAEKRFLARRRDALRT